MDNERAVVKCGSCGAVIGEMFTIEPGQVRLLVGGVLVNVARGVCVSCGAEFHWSISERMLAELIQRLSAMREV